MRSTAMTLAILGCSLLYVPVHAGNQEQGACRADIQRLCKDVAAGRGAIARCLSQHQSELSPACRERMAQAKQRTEEFANACGVDLEKLCKKGRPGGGGALRCLAANKDSLSSACRDQIAAAERRHPCMADIQRLCSDMEPGEGRINRCLSEHQAELNTTCKAALAKAGKAKD